MRMLNRYRGEKVSKSYIEIQSTLVGAKAFIRGQLRILISKDDGLWHLRISHPQRLPTSSEIVHARYSLLPDDIYMAQILPPKSEYVNVHPTTMHLYQIKP